MRQLHRLLRLRLRDAVRRTFIKGHGDVDAEPLLNVDRSLGREKVRGAVDVRTELDALFAQLPNRREGEHLKPSRIRKDGAIPRHEFMYAAQLLDQVDAGAEH